MQILKLKNLDIGYEKNLLKNINLSANQGELIALIGINGVGKSTLLKTISGIIPKRKGNIYLENKKLEKYTKQKLATILGFSAINQIFINNITVKDVISLGRIPYTSLLGTLKKKDEEIILNAIEKCGLEKIRNKEISKISDGQRQRAFIARLIAQQTKLLLFDEPTAFLDIEGKYQIAYLFKQIVREMNRTIIFSTHDLKIAIQTADKIWLFIDNTIVSALPEDLILRNYFERLFSYSKINFNNFTADFDVKSNVKDKIQIKNNSTEIRRIWTDRALLKYGYVPDFESKKIIYIFDSYWQYNSENFDSLEKLIKNL